MKHPCIEFILACACCDVLGEFVRNLAPEVPEIDTRVYVAGEDTDYIPKYGVVTESILIINESEVLPELNKAEIRKAFQDLAKTVKK